MIQSAEEFVRLRKSERADEYGRAANEEAPVEVWYDVISRYPEMRFWVAHNKTAPIEIVAFLASDRDRQVRSMVSMKRKLSPEILELLAADEDESVRLNVARHRRTPRRVLEQLAHDPWERIRQTAEEKLAQLP